MDKFSLTPARALTLAVHTLGLLACGQAAAAGGSEKLPFYLSASQTVLRDSNFSRTDKAQAETVSSTAALLGFSKAYGRQQFDLNTQYAINRYAHYKEALDNDSKQMNGSVSSQFLANWQLSLGGSYSQNLNPIKDNVNVERVVKNIRTYNSRNIALRYGLDSLWSVTLTGDANSVRYSRQAYRGFEADQQSASVRVNYYPTNTLVWGLAYRPVKTHYVNSSADRTINDHNIDVSANWLVTGLSKVDATFTRRRTTYSDDNLASTRSWSGSLGWRYTPGGLFSYTLNASRYTGTDRVNTQFSGFDVNEANARRDTVNLSTNFSASIAAAFTAKTSMRLSHGLSKNRYNYTSVANFSGQAEQAQILGIPLSDFLCTFQGYCNTQFEVRSIQHTTGLTLTYVPMRAVSTQCDLQVYSQTRDRYGIRYQGRSLGCSVTATLDSFSTLFESLFE